MNNTFCVSDFGMVEGLFGIDVKANTLAVKAAVEACASNGGGEVLFPKGCWRTGPIHLRSHVKLNLGEGAYVVFEDDPKMCLPLVKTTWEGVECMNYSPLVYAFECEDVGIIGKGTLAPKMTKWREWFVGGEIHRKVRGEIYDMMSRGEPVENRILAERGGYFRPQLLQFNRCRNVILKDFRIRESPFWTIHIFRCNGVEIRGLDSRALGHNSDGINLEKTKNVIVRDCVLQQGDDGIVIKGGRNRDGWDGESSSENIDIENVNLTEGHGLLVVGSELSGGVRNVRMRKCHLDGSSFALFAIKTNLRRGGFVKDIQMDDCRCELVKEAVRITTDSSMYPYATYDVRRTDIDGITIRNCSLGKADILCMITGDEECPVRNLHIENLKAELLGTEEMVCGNAPGFEAIHCGADKVSKEEAAWDWDVPKPWYAEYDAPAEFPTPEALAAAGDVGDFKLTFRARNIAKDAALSIRSAVSVALSGEAGAVGPHKPMYDAINHNAEWQEFEIIVHRKAISVKINDFEVVCNRRLGADFPLKGALELSGVEIDEAVLSLITGQKY